MRTVVSLIAVACGALMVSTSALAQDDSWDFAAPHKQRCSLGTMLDMNLCLAAEYKEVDARLNNAYTELTASLADPSVLRKSQAAWLKFRDLDCQYAS